MFFEQSSSDSDATKENTSETSDAVDSDSDSDNICELNRPVTEKTIRLEKRRKRSTPLVEVLPEKSFSKTYL